MNSYANSAEKHQQITQNSIFEYMPVHDLLVIKYTVVCSACKAASIVTHTHTRLSHN